MKGCFYLQRRFAYLGHALAEQLLQRGMTSCCGLTATRPSEAFLRTQKTVAFSTLLVEDDLYANAEKETLDMDYLEALERGLDIPNLWSMILPDRVVVSGQLLRAYPHDHAPYTHEDMLRIVQSCAKTLSKFLDDEKPDFVLFSVAGNIASLLLYHLARQRGIRTLFIDCARIGTGYFLTDTYGSSPLLWETWKRIREQPTEEDASLVVWGREWLASFRKKPRYYLDASSSQDAVERAMNPRAFTIPGWRALRVAWEDFAAYIRDPHRHDYDRIKPWWNVWDRLVRRVRLARGYADLFEEPREGEPHAYFALHAEPESYPAVLAPFYTDQVWLARQIARSLPVGWKLYVKDHPVMLGLRPRAYYRALRRIPNVRFINPRRSGLETAAAADLTLTLTGTAAWEALLLGKPAMTFGPMFYEPLSGVRLCRSIQELPRMIREHLASFHDDPEELASFLAALRTESVDVDLVHLWDVKGGADAEENRKRLAPLADRIAETLKRPPSAGPSSV